MSKRLHAARHREWCRGIEVPGWLVSASPYGDLAERAAGSGWLLWRVRGTDPIAGRKYAHRAGQLLQREMGYSFAPWPRRKPMKGTERAEEVFYAALADCRLVSFVIVGWVDRYGAWDGVAERVHLLPGRPRLAVLHAWTALERRRCGLAKGLVEVVAGLHGVDVRELAYAGPFSPAGKALAFSLGGDRVFVA